MRIMTSAVAIAAKLAQHVRKPGAKFPKGGEAAIDRTEGASLSLYHADLAGLVARRVTRADVPELLTLVREMARFCRVRDGVGLAAPQVGVNLQLAIVLAPGGAVKVLINPEIQNLAGRDLLEAEGCLSLPGQPEPDGTLYYPTARIWRSEICAVRSGTLADPEAALIMHYKGYTARIVQHEIDHLKGIFFIDRCQEPARQIVLKRYGRYLEQLKRARYRTDPFAGGEQP